MKILLISSRFHPFTGGVENVVLNLAKQFQAKGHEVLVVASRMGPAQNAKETIEGVPVKRFWLNLPRSVLGFLVFPIRFVIGLMRLIGQIKRFRPDTINYHFPDDSSVYVWLALGETPLILNIHGNDLQVFGKKPWYRFFLKRLIKKSQTVVVNSSYIKSELGKDFPEALEKTRIIPNGVDKELFEITSSSHPERIPPRTRGEERRISALERDSSPKGLGAQNDNEKDYILFLGRLVPKKGVDILIKAFANVQNELESNLIIVGDGPERSKLENMVQETKLEQRITFTGNQTGQARLDLIRQAKFAVMPSRREPFGIVALELMAAGKALIASQTGGLGEIIENGQTGILFENENVANLAEKMVRLEKDSERRKQLGETAHQEAKQYQWKEIAERYLSVFSTAFL